MAWYNLSSRSLKTSGHGHHLHSFMGLRKHPSLTSIMSPLAKVFCACLCIETESWAGPTAGGGCRSSQTRPQKVTMGAVKDTADAVHFALLMPASLSQSQKYTHTRNTAVHRQMMKLYGVETYSLSVKSKTYDEGLKRSISFKKM